MGIAPLRGVFAEELERESARIMKQGPTRIKERYSESFDALIRLEKLGGTELKCFKNYLTVRASFCASVTAVGYR